MEWVHCHIARQASPAPRTVEGHSESACLGIVMKLLAKTAEERYQTAAGLAARSSALSCRMGDATRDRRVPAWREHDTPDRLLIPEKLYGREREVETSARRLRPCRQRVARRSWCLCPAIPASASPPSSMNCTKRLFRRAGLFASGKFDQYKRDVPYATLAQAFQSLVRPLLTKSDTELRGWRDAFARRSIRTDN